MLRQPLGVGSHNTVLMIETINAGVKYRSRASVDNERITEKDGNRDGVLVSVVRFV
jgi:hypothetical protein